MKNPASRPNFAVVMAAALITVLSTFPSIALATTISGRLRYQDREYTRAGFTGSQPYLPIRFAQVEVTGAGPDGNFDTTGDNPSPVWTSTDAAGNYSCSVDGWVNQNVRVTVYARQDNSQYRISVRNNPSAGQVYAARSSPVEYNGTPITIDVDVPIASNGGPFNIFDCLVDGINLARSLSGRSPYYMCTAYWQPGSTDGTYYQPYGRTIHLLGTSSDPDEYDDDIILHEFGHFVMHEYSRFDSPGGGHYLTRHYDIRLTWSEGWAHFFSCCVKRSLNKPDITWQVDTIGSTPRLAFDLEGPSYSAECKGSDNELSVAAVLWDIMDSPDEADASPGTDDDPIAAGLDEIWTLFDLYLESLVVPPYSNQASIERFFDGWLSTFPAVDVLPVFLSRSINFSEDSYDSSGSNDTAATATSISVDGSACDSTFYAAGDTDFFSFPTLTGARYRVESLNLSNYCYPRLLLYGPDGTTVIAQSSKVDELEVSTWAPAVNFTAGSTGPYYVCLSRYDGVEARGKYGSYQLRVVKISDPPPDSGQPDDGDGGRCLLRKTEEIPRVVVLLAILIACAAARRFRPASC